MTLVEMKAAAYDVQNAIQRLTAQLRRLQQEIANEEAKPKDPVAEDKPACSPNG